MLDIPAAGGYIEDIATGKAGKTMIVLITGASHTGKTLLAQRLLEKYKYPYLSIDHLKMGLIRSGNTRLTPTSGVETLTAYLWPIVREMVKTAIENGQNLTVEGCYIPFDWEKDFSAAERAQIRYVCLVMREDYIKSHFSDIRAHANAVERRVEDDFSVDKAIAENRKFAVLAEKHGQNRVYIEKEYKIDIEL